MHGLGTLDGGHLHDGLCSEGTRIHFGDLLQLGGQVHLFHQIAIVVAAGRTVGTEAHGYSGGPLFNHGGHTASQHHVAGRIVHAADAFCGEKLAVGCVDPDTVCDNDVRSEKSDTIHVLNGSGVVLREAVV